MSENNANANDELEKENKFSEQFTAIYNTIALYKMQLSSLQKLVKNVENNVLKELKSSKKKALSQAAKKDKVGPRGFAKPCKVSDELCVFMGQPIGTKIARTEVSKALATYIKTHNLLSPDNKQKIVPNEVLLQLLQISNDELDTLTYFNLQKYMNKHFFKE